MVMGDVPLSVALPTPRWRRALRVFLVVVLFCFLVLVLGLYFAYRPIPARDLPTGMVELTSMQKFRSDSKRLRAGEPECQIGVVVELKNGTIAMPAHLISTRPRDGGASRLSWSLPIDEIHLYSKNAVVRYFLVAMKKGDDARDEYRMSAITREEILQNVEEGMGTFRWPTWEEMLPDSAKKEFPVVRGIYHMARRFLHEQWSNAPISRRDPRARRRPGRRSACASRRAGRG